jgi:hypothetical protein
VQKICSVSDKGEARLIAEWHLRRQKTGLGGHLNIFLHKNSYIGKKAGL